MEFERLLHEGAGLPWSGSWAWPGLVLAAAAGLSALALLTGRSPAWLPGTRRLPLQTQFTLGIAVIALVPGLLLAVVLVETGAADAESRIERRLIAATDAATRSLERRINSYRRGMMEFATLLGEMPDRSTPRLERLLDLHLATDSDFLTLLVTDERGHVIAARADPADFPSAALPPIPDVADREYFIVPMRDGGAFLSGVFQGRGFGTHRIVALSAAIPGPSGPMGVLQGAYDVGTIDRVRDVVPMDPASEILVLDGAGAMVFAATGWDLDADARAEITRLAATPGEVARGYSAGTGLAYLTAAQTNNLGWTTVIRVPLSAIVEQVEQQTRGLVFALVAWALLSLFMGWWLARAIARPVHDLAASFARFDPETTVERLPDLPPGASRELRSLHAGVVRSQRRLRRTYRRLRQTLAQEARLRHDLDQARDQQEQVIATRTQELKQKNAQLEMANNELIVLARIDGLTGIPNHRAFEERLAAQWQMLRRVAQPLALVVVDVDLFKKFNDRYGHAKGDACLRSVAEALTSVAQRSSDFVARYGGEEFVLLLSATDLEGAGRLAEEARQAVAALGLAHADGIGGQVSISAGVAVAVPAFGGSPEQLFVAADKALYEAKRAGRDRVELSAVVPGPAGSGRSAGT